MVETGFWRFWARRLELFLISIGFKKKPKRSIHYYLGRL
ncbi:hypothetical protein LEP1GSC038_4182 [Leptospira weilii str. 2006001855]|uniref:Uncharacterized protein n=1 Tax=Leptospira weilii str. 2006001855 TaxID=996804 RepID=M6FYR6_9LEPT|nr:hypothetical protein LEP1GSC038_4182 [Leptospira weilii str. 2006001855]